MMKSLRILTLVLVAASVFGSCAKELTDLPDNTSGSETISFGMDGSFSAKVQTKATEVTSLSSFYVTAVTGSAGSESQVWNSVQFNQVPGSSPATYVGDKSWPLSDPGYKFYGSNVALNFAAGGTYVNASNATDVVCAYLSSPTYKTKNTLTFEHIFARLCRVDVAAQTGYTVSNISMYITPKTGGTYNLRTGAGYTDGTGWSSITTGSATLISDKTGATDNDIYMVPGNYAITCTWTATDASGVSVTHTNEASTLPIKGGATNNISVVLGGDIMLGVDLQDYCEYDYRDNLDYLTFYCDEAGTIGWKCSRASISRTIQYSKDFGATWTDLTSTTSGATVAVNAGDIVWFKGSNTAYANYLFDSNTFTLSNKAHVYGNVNSLTGNNTSVSRNCFSSLFGGCSKLYTYEHKKIILPATTLATSCYSEMFYGCTSITAAPELPATTLVNYCYSLMFSRCTSLTAAPELPATTMKVSCYDGMFERCTSLTTAPELPATTLAESCYSSMFGGCTSLTTAPELPATTLAASCYSNMFNGCASLTAAPELPATTLASSCYSYMFSGCASLTAAPELPATTLADYCYDSMFKGCSSLNYIKALFTTTPSSSYTNNWVSGVATTGTFVKSVDATWDVTGNNGVPTGWTIKIDDNRSDAGISLSVDSIVFGDTASIDVFLPCDATGNVTLSVEDWYQETAAPINGKSMFNIDTYNSSTGEYLLAGTHTAVVTYEGDSNYKPKVETISFEISKIQSNITITNITLDGDTADIDVELPNDAGSYCQTIDDTEGQSWQAGGVLLKCNGTPFAFVNSTDGRASVELFDIYNFDITSPISVRAIFLGDDKYLPAVSEPAYINIPIFSVSADKIVKFSPGNLQAVIDGGPTDTYNYSASVWKFAENQYDFIGNAAGNTTFAVGSTVDLFGWVGASASYDSYGLCTNTSGNNVYYGMSASDALKTDWGSIQGVVSSCGSGWRTLTKTEWNYLFIQRTNASSLYGQCQISTANGTVTGMLILPDNWTKPSNCTVTPGSGAFDRVTYSATASSGASNAWSDMEAAGAVFLPVAGSRRGVSVDDEGRSSRYWSSSVNADYGAYQVYFESGYLNPQEDSAPRFFGFPVRLVKDYD